MAKCQSEDCARHGCVSSPECSISEWPNSSDLPARCACGLPVSMLDANHICTSDKLARRMGAEFTPRATDDEDDDDNVVHVDFGDNIVGPERQLYADVLDAINEHRHEVSLPAILGMIELVKATVLDCALGDYE